MARSARAQALIEEFGGEDVRMGALKARAREIRTDHALALELWASGRFHPRMLALLIMDKAALDQIEIEALAEDMTAHEAKRRDYLSDWLLANQLMKTKRLSELIGGWADHASPVLRRLFWYHQARLRWTGQAPPDNTEALQEALEARMEGEHPMVQWAMNFCAGQIGVRQSEHRERCVRLGERLGLYAEEKAPKNCTPNYLPDFIRIEAAKLEA